MRPKAPRMALQVSCPTWWSHKGTELLTLTVNFGLSGVRWRCRREKTGVHHPPPRSTGDLTNPVSIGHPPPQRPAARPRLTYGLQIRGSQDPLLRFTHWLEWLTELRETLDQVHWLILKDVTEDTEDQPKGRCVGRGVGEGQRGLRVLSGVPGPPHVQRTPSFGVFIETSLHRHGWLNQCPMAIESISSPSLPSGGGGRLCNEGWGWKFQPSNLTGSFLLQADSLVKLPPEPEPRAPAISQSSH